MLPRKNLSWDPSGPSLWGVFFFFSPSLPSLQNVAGADYSYISSTLLKLVVVLDIGLVTAIMVPEELFPTMNTFAPRPFFPHFPFSCIE